MIQYLRYLSAIIFVALGSINSQAQIKKSEPKNALMLHIHYGYHAPGFDMAKSFGNKFSIGGDIEYKLKSDFFVGFSYSHLYGKKIKEKVAYNLINTKSETIISPYLHYRKEASIACFQLVRYFIQAPLPKEV